MNKHAASQYDFQVTRYAWRDIAARFLPLIRPHRWRWLTAAILVSLVGVAVALVPLFPKYIIDEAIPRKNFRLAIGAASVFLVVQFVRMVLWYAAMRLVYRVQQSVMFDLRSQGFGHLQKLCLRFHNKYPSGFLYERVFGSSINTIGGFLQVIFQSTATYFCGMIFSLGFCIYLSPPLTVLILMGASGYVVTARLLSKKIYTKSQISIQAQSQVVDVIMDKLRGHKTIQAFAIEDRVQDELEEQLWPAMTKWLDAVLESMKLGFVSEGLGYVITACVVVGGAAAVMGWNMPLGTLVAFMGYQGSLTGLIQSLTNTYGQLMGARAAADQLFTVMDTHATVIDKPDAQMPASVKGHMEFRDVTFGYADQPVLQNFSASIPAGQTVALVGRSGSGKTTITNILMRFYDPDSGSIRLDGINIRDLPLRAYRSLYGVVLQDPYLFDTTVASNLRYACPTATEAELIDILKKARAWDFVNSFPGRLNHRVGEAGGQLSGGQRQRLAIARCMLVPSRFIVLDEATSALDVESEAMIQAGLDSLFRDKTVIIIAHRLSTIRRVDRILVIDEGRLVEDGTFEQLLQMRGLFHYMHSIATSASLPQAKLEQAGFA